MAPAILTALRLAVRLLYYLVASRTHLSPTSPREHGDLVRTMMFGEMAEVEARLVGLCRDTNFSGKN
jgi:hypothetical protein